MSSPRTSRIIAPLLYWLKPDLSEDTVSRVVTVVRKAGHMTEYAILACLLWRALRKPRKGDHRPWHWREAGIVLLIAGAYAVSDEFHQAFVPSRQASQGDVLLDVGGALLGLLALWQAGRWCKRW